ncbi:dihydrolipoamide acetyltransferase family protein [Cellulosimicrobium funkei]|uniref:Dihydrolipoamide acetyltransferase component of pyruvate dehydrogenase complex n=1 Tax=Cellulosimicrobium funkei TaxID=264251 RepID=A0A4Y8R3F6_9MICO|nr:dihydrolipoamide acetyltransferase family protein [Cellulosimicrobium funkei]TFF12595.1 2-oxo acid dehydrogenase subunit E2 [Cellulosimicrobium funkei]TGA77286.1 2-oxo acid dehydrogenase subunit E2 [Cellulosimicrobium terreum]
MPTFEKFNLPDAGEGLTEAEIVHWHVAVGDAVTVNQTIVEIETAKSLVELPSPYTGVVTEILTPEGTTVEVGVPIIVVDTDPGGTAPAPTAPAGVVPDGADAPAAAASPQAGTGDATPAASEGSGSVLVGYGTVEPGTARRRRRAAEPAAAAPAAEPTAAAPATDRPGPAAPDRTAPAASIAASAPAPTPAPRASAPAAVGHATLPVLAKPPVRKLAKDLGVDLASVAGTGPGGIVTREDVQAYHEQAKAQPLATYADDDQPWLATGAVTADGRQTRVPVKSVRKRTAEAMVTSAFTAPHVTVFHTVDVTRTMKLVRTLREDREFADVRVTPLLVTAKALLLAVRRHPEINASWDDAAQEIVYKHYVNLGIAAATPRGLVVPNIKDAHRLDLHGLAGGIADLTATARAGRTSPTDMSDGTITITNVGVFGIDTGTPILNPGEAAILAFGAIREQPWVHKGKIRKRWVTQLALSFDHRLVDGELGARVLADVARILEDPARGLVWG